MHYFSVVGQSIVQGHHAATSEELMNISRIAARACLNIKIWNTTLKTTLHKIHQRLLDPEAELHPNVDISCNLDQLRELYRFLGSILEVVDGEDLKSGVID